MVACTVGEQLEGDVWLLQKTQLQFESIGGPKHPRGNSHYWVCID